MTTTIIWTIAIITVLGVVLAVVLYLVAKKFRVEEDPRIDEVEKVMPGANCGGCGFAGCRAFAQSCVEAMNLDNNFCPVGGNDVMKKVAAVLGLEVKEKAPMVAVVRCNGTCANRCGDCVAACQFGAISMDPETGLPVVDEEKCTACGACVKACPKRIIELRNKGPKNRRVFVSCVNMEKGAVARKSCKAACIGCGKCEKACPFGAIKVEHNVAYIDFEKCRLCRKCVVECPTGAIRDVNFPAPAVKPAPKPAAPAQAAKPAAPAQQPSEATAAAEKPVAPVKETEHKVEPEKKSEE